MRRISVKKVIAICLFLCLIAGTSNAGFLFGYMMGTATSGEDGKGTTPNPTLLYVNSEVNGLEDPMLIWICKTDYRFRQKVCLREEFEKAVGKGPVLLWAFTVPGDALFYFVYTSEKNVGGCRK